MHADSPMMESVISCSGEHSGPVARRGVTAKVPQSAMGYESRIFWIARGFFWPNPLGWKLTTLPSHDSRQRTCSK